MTRDKEILRFAHEIQKKYSIKYFEEVHGFKLKHEKIDLDFYELLKAASLKLSKNTQRIYQTSISSLKKFTKAEKLSILKIDEAFLCKYFEYLDSIGNSVSYQQTLLKRIRKVFNELNKSGTYANNPARNIKLKKVVKNKIEVLTVNELQKLATYPCKNNSVKNAYLFSCNTGLRISDICSLTFNNIKQMNGYYELYIIVTKTKEPLRLKLNRDAEKIFLKQLVAKKNSYVFQGLTAQYIRRVQKDWFHSCGITRNLMFHSSRHTFAVNFLNQPKVDIYKLKEALGHSSISSTLIYAQFIEEEKYKA